MNAGIAFISRKSRKTDVAWRYAIAVVLVVCCIGLAYVEIVVAPWFINEVVSMFPETTLLKEPSMFWEWAILLAVQATLLCTAALQHLLHADVIWSESHAFVEGLGFGVAGPDVERYVVAAGLTGDVQGFDIGQDIAVEVLLEHAECVAKHLVGGGGVGVMFGVIAVIGRWRNRHEHRGLIVGQNRLQFLVRVFLDTAFEQIRSAGMMHFEHLPQQFVDLGNIGRRGPTNRHVIH